MRALAAVGATIRDLVVFVVVVPVREGRLRSRLWPAGLAPVAVVAVAAYAVAIAGAVFGGAVRASSELAVNAGTSAVSLPAGAAAPVLALVVLCIALAQTAVLHLPWWLAATVTAFSTLVLATVAAREVGDQPVTVSRVVAAGSIAGLWTLLALRRRRAFAWWEFATVLLVLALGIGLPVATSTRAFAAAGLDYRPILLAELLQTVGLLALPAAVAAGAAVVQLSAVMASAVVTAVRRRLPVVVGAVLLALVVVWRVTVVGIELAAGGRDLGIAPITASVVLLAALVGLWLLVERLRGPAAPPVPTELESRFAEVAPRAASLVVIGVVPSVFLTLIAGIVFALTFSDAASGGFAAASEFFGDSRVVGVTRLVAGAALLALGLQRARRGREVLPEVLVSIGFVVATSAVATLAGVSDALWTGPAFLLTVTAAAVAVGAVLVVRRRLTPDRAAAIAVVLLVAALFDQRTFVADPFTALFGFAGPAVVLVVGFVWSLVTGGADVNETSVRYPRPSRVLVYLASSLFGVTVLAFASLARDPGATIDLSASAGIGEELLGTALLAAVVVTSLARAAGRGGVTAVPATDGEASASPDVPATDAETSVPTAVPPSASADATAPSPPPLAPPPRGALPVPLPPPGGGLPVSSGSTRPAPPPGVDA